MFPILNYRLVFIDLQTPRAIFGNRDAKHRIWVAQVGYRQPCASKQKKSAIDQVFLQQEYIEVRSRIISVLFACLCMCNSLPMKKTLCEVLEHSFLQGNLRWFFPSSWSTRGFLSSFFLFSVRTFNNHPMSLGCFRRNPDGLAQYKSIHPLSHLFIYPSFIRLFIELSVSMSVHSSIHQSIDPSIHSSNPPYIHASSQTPVFIVGIVHTYTGKTEGSFGTGHMQTNRVCRFTSNTFINVVMFGQIFL